jgi:hypothetical protein
MSPNLTTAQQNFDVSSINAITISLREIEIENADSINLLLINFDTGG